MKCYECEARVDTFEFQCKLCGELFCCKECLDRHDGAIRDIIPLRKETIN